ncbi:MAG: ArsR/SmtB family transcription factor [Nanoarchaeota archaeon]
MKYEKLAKTYKCLGEPVRLNILEFLVDKRCCASDCCICKITEHIKRDQSVVFRHIQALKDAGLVETKKDNKFLYCRVKDIKRAKKLLEG